MADRKRRGGKHPGPVHIMAWAPQDWLSSPLRGELALERDHLTRAVYRDLLDVLHERGGFLRRSEVAGACHVTPEEAEHAVARLLASERIRENGDGQLFNVRVLEGLADKRDWQAKQAQSGSKGGKASAASKSPEERSEAAKQASNARWSRERSEPAHIQSEPADACAGMRSLLSSSSPPHSPSESEADADERMGARGEEEADQTRSAADPGRRRSRAPVPAGAIVEQLVQQPGKRLPTPERVAWVQSELGDTEPQNRALFEVCAELPEREIERALIVVRTRMKDGQAIGKPVAYFLVVARERIAEINAAATRGAR